MAATIPYLEKCEGAAESTVQDGERRKVAIAYSLQWCQPGIEWGDPSQPHVVSSRLMPAARFPNNHSFPAGREMVPYLQGRNYTVCVLASQNADYAIRAFGARTDLRRWLFSSTVSGTWSILPSAGDDSSSNDEVLLAALG